MVTFQVVREPLIGPFAFKAHEINELWQVIVGLPDGAGGIDWGLGAQSPVWGDPMVVDLAGIDGANMMMAAITGHAARVAADLPEDLDPVEVQARLMPEVLLLAREMTNESIAESFVMNALVPIDQAMWQRWARRHEIRDFADLIPPSVRPYLPVDPANAPPAAEIPLVSPTTGAEEIGELLARGLPLLKIRIGADPNRDKDPSAMLDFDANRVIEVAAMVDRAEQAGATGVRLYLDANGRYPDKATLLTLLDRIDDAGALHRIALVEEPLPVANDEHLGDLPVPIGADESAFDTASVERRAATGYSVIAVKPSAKTLTRSFAMIEAAGRAGMNCLVADLTAPPLLVAWNREVASRLTPLPGLERATFESNGPQNYLHWADLSARLPQQQPGEPAPNLIDLAGHYLPGYGE
ncbi:enolase C-terminal domain-like protein [Parenemella sanctibonifatiensis]|nr:enolase C-terminal domain-like protein [Parenemella sanctibonifatiensis]